MNKLANDPGPEIETLIRQVEARMIEIRRDIHAHPETGFDTVRTAAKVAEELRAIGLKPKTGVGRTGVVVEIEGGAPGPCLILRADMDALPIQERTGLPYASTVPGKMHACGHDLHTSALLGAAHALKEMAPKLRGTVRLVFQPAEETLESGAAAMLADGAGEGRTWPLPSTTAQNWKPKQGAAEPGCLSTASSDEFKVTIRGKSGHAARPHAAIDPIVGAAHVIAQLQTIISREMNPARSAVLTIGHIFGGETQNIIPDSCTFEGTARCRSAESRDRVEDSFRRICTNAAAAMNLEAEIDYVRGVLALINDDAMVDRAVVALEAQFGVAPLVSEESNFGAEDFSLFSERMPSIQIHVGAQTPGRDDRVHNSDYQPNESCIADSAIVLTRMATELLG